MMKTIQNPTTYFFQQSNNPPTEYKQKIEEFVSKLVNLKNCVLCKEDFDFKNRIPRILIHCGHTFCTSCLNNFYKNQRVRCPLCLKLIKNLDTIERLPVNHTIFTRIANEINAKNRENGEKEIDLQAYLVQQFEAAQQKKPQQASEPQQQQYVNLDQNGQPVKIDEESGLEFCPYHQDRLKHFFCMVHKVTCCRACSEMMHAKNDCVVVDLYEIEDVHGFLAEFQKSSANQPQELQQQQQLVPPMNEQGIPQVEEQDIGQELHQFQKGIQLMPQQEPGVEKFDNFIQDDDNNDDNGSVKSY